MSTADLLSPLAAASLDNPLYYLENGLTVIDWVLKQHTDLLTTSEHERLTQFQAMPQAAQALLLRMIMRTHDQFRVSGLVYPELPMTVPEALNILAQEGWVDVNPPLTVEDLNRLLRRDEWLAMLEGRLDELGLKRTASKRAMVTVWTALHGHLSQPLVDWWPDSPEKVVALRDPLLFQRVRLMFFGNLRQDWSEFVVTELGYQRYEPVPLTRECRAFQHRDEVDLYLALHECREQLQSEAPDLQALWQSIPGEADMNPWLSYRRDRLLHSLGHRAEREGLIDLALQAYRSASTAESRVRYFRVREKHHEPSSVWPDVFHAWQQATAATERQHLQRILNRLARKVEQPAPPERESPEIPVDLILLRDTSDFSVEMQVAHALSDNVSRCYYVENGLFTGLLALLCWPAFYAAIPGAFFHPFQAGPADLYRDDFVARRRQLFDECLAALDEGDYKERIWHHWRRSQGIACPLVSWPVLTESLIDDALRCIPAEDLKSVFNRLLVDLRRYRNGLPDLIRFWPNEYRRGESCPKALCPDKLRSDKPCSDKPCSEKPRYELIEVKAPGDRLQDHQRHWLEFFVEQDIPARVTHVTWAPVA